MRWDDLKEEARVWIAIAHYDPGYVGKKIVSGLTYMLAGLATSFLVGLCLGRGGGEFLLWVYGWQRDVLIVTVVLGVLGVLCIRNNVRCLPLSLRAYLLRLLAGQDVLVANGYFGYHSANIYVPKDTSFVGIGLDCRIVEEYGILIDQDHNLRQPHRLHDISVDDGFAQKPATALVCGSGLNLEARDSISE